MGGQHHHGDELIDDLNQEVVLNVEGMTCNNCAAKVSKALSSVSSVVDVHVDLGAKEAHLHGVDESGASAEEFIAALNAAGYPAKLKSRGQKNSVWSKWSTVVGVGATLTVIMMIGDWALGWQTSSSGRLTLFLLSTIIQLYCGQAFLKGALRQLRKGSSDMDTLVALGSWTAYIYSTWSYLSDGSHHLYFAEAGSIISLVSLGHFLEAKISERAQSSLKKLISLQNDRVTRVLPGGESEIVPSARLKVGDRILVRSGDRIPVDAIIAKGGASIDESAITGESHPIDKDPGAKLISGTLVMDGEIEARVTAVGRATALAQIIETVRKAQNSRAAIQKLADKVSSIFVPIVVLVALVAFGLWFLTPATMIALQARIAPWLWPTHIDPSLVSQAVMCAVGVLIIACPCAMGLATPAALMAGAGRAAKNGVLIRDASAIEKSATITRVFFDKTGTLTEGKLSVEATLGAADLKPQHWGAIAELTRKSHHPMSQAVLRHVTATQATPQSSDLSTFKEERGKGLTGETPYGDVYRLGSIAWHRDVLKLNSPLFAQAESSVASANVFSHDGHVLAIFLLKDQIKSESAEVVRQLRAVGIEVGIISGDRRAVVEELAKSLGLKSENVHFEITPERKAEVISGHQAQGQAVAFVGDGINDAPALKTATLGIAVAAATDIAKDSADLVLIKNDIRQIPWALDISGRTLRTIKQNLFWAFCYNTLAVPLAFMGFVSPIICAAAMGLSDVFVILNSLRLARYRSHLAGEAK